MSFQTGAIERKASQRHAALCVLRELGERQWRGSSGFFLGGWSNLIHPRHKGVGVWEDSRRHKGVGGGRRAIRIRIRMGIAEESATSRPPMSGVRNFHGVEKIFHGVEVPDFSLPRTQGSRAATESLDPINARGARGAKGTQTPIRTAVFSRRGAEELTMCDAAGCKRISAVWKFKISYSSDSDLDPFPAKNAKSAKELGRFSRGAICVHLRHLRLKIRNFHGMEVPDFPGGMV
jgi:hypothetical protein